MSFYPFKNQPLFTGNNKANFDFAGNMS